MCHQLSVHLGATEKSIDIRDTPWQPPASQSSMYLYSSFENHVLDWCSQAYWISVT